MGYTHYWYRKKEYTREDMTHIVLDFKKMIPVLSELGVHIAGGNGTGPAIINIEDICFNGPEKCGHLKNEEITIPWPSNSAGGVAGFTEDVKSGEWFAGALIDKRCCDGDCSYETVTFPRILNKQYEHIDEKTGLYFDCCKTAYRPYDLALNVFLVICKHHLKDKIKISSDGEIIHWQESMMLCQVSLGYGLDFKLKEGE